MADRLLTAIVGGDTLLGQELKEVLESRKPSPRVILVSASEEGTSFMAEGDEAVVLPPMTRENLEDAKAVFLAGSQASSRRAKALGLTAKLVDLTGALDGSVPHPAATAIFRFLLAAAQAGKIDRSLAHVYEPASERGKRGIEELQQQTIAVLNFQKLKTDVFDTQAAFNMLAAYGEEAEEGLDVVEARLISHLETLLGGRIPMPSLRLVQAPVFHGYSISVWIRFAQAAPVEALTGFLSSSGFDVRAEEPPANAGIAGESGISVGAISVDRQDPNACWAWLVADNLRLAAESAVARIEDLA